MKKFVVSLVSALTLMIPTQVLARDWIPVDGRVFVDADSVIVNKRYPNIRYSSDIFRGNRPGYFVIRRVSNCASRSTRILEKVTYNNVGRVINKTSFNNRGIYATPGKLIDI